MKSNNINEKILKLDFHRIKDMGYVDCSRENNKDGGIGNTYEDLLGVNENNLKKADYLGFEVKSKRLYNESYISLYCKSPSYPKRANGYLRETYGEIRMTEHSKKILYASVFGHRDSLVYNKYLMRLNVNRDEKKIFLIIKNLEGVVLDSVYWTLDDLKKAATKMKSLFLVLAEIRKNNNKNQYHYVKGEIYHNFNFDSFIDNIENGGIMFDIRIGVYNSGKKYGKTHDHGSGFRVKKENFYKLYESYEELN